MHDGWMKGRYITTVFKDGVLGRVEANRWSAGGAVDMLQGVTIQ